MRAVQVVAHHVVVLSAVHKTLTAIAAACCALACYRAPLSAEFIPSLTIKASDLVQDGASLAPQVIIT
jgi:hypothetical protein